MPLCGVAIPGMVRASTSTKSGRTLSASTARLIATSVARRMSVRSISSGSTTPSANASARAAISRARRARSGGASSFESRTPWTGRSRSRTTAPATTGPARQPRPTSSTPATTRYPSTDSRRSCVQPAVPRQATRLPLGFFFDARCLSLAIPQIVELRPSHLAPTHDLDLADDRRVHRKDPPDADAVGAFPDGEGAAGAAPLHGDHHAAEDLDAILLPFFDLHVHLDGVAYPEGGRVALDLSLFDQLHEIHGVLPPRSSPVQCSWIASALPRARGFKRSGRLRAVASCARARRQAAMRPWCPESRMSGTFKPRKLAGRV